MRNFRTSFVVAAMAFVVLRAWFANQGISIVDWVWIFVVSALFFAVGLALRRDRPYMRKLAAVVALAAAISGTAILCATPPPRGDCSHYPQGFEEYCVDSLDRGGAVVP